MHSTLRRELIISFIGLAVIPLLMVGVFSIWQSSTTLRNEVTASQVAIAELTAAETAQFFKEIAGDLTLITKLTGLDTLTADEIELRLSELLVHEDELLELAFLDASGVEIARQSKSAPRVAPTS